MSRQFIVVTPVNSEAYGDTMLIPVDRIEVVHEESGGSGSYIWVAVSVVEGPDCYWVRESVDVIAERIGGAS